MEMQDFTITKRDGSKDRFSLDKIMNAIIKAFDSVGQAVDLGTVSKIISHIDIHEGIKVEDIQNQVEEGLMREGHYKVAKSFMLYRQQHTEDRETIQKLQFLTDYMEATNAATGSKYDANANVEHKNIATLIGELPKSSFIRLNRRLLTDRIKKMYGKALADEYIDMLTHHFIYKNDETSLANYCASITMYPWLIGGTTSIGGNSTAPTNLKSFCGGFINMVFMVSSMLSGACATPEFLMYMNYFIGKEKIMSEVRPSCTVWPLMSRWKCMACTSRNFSLLTHSPSAAAPSKPLHRSQGCPASRSFFCSSRAVKSMPTVTAS